MTPLPQSGNPKPRIFRLTEDAAVINRLGFNNEGHAAAERRLAERAWRAGTVGVNIGANKDSADRIRDYELGVERFAPLASYLTVNISSPNTPGLRDMQARASLAELLARVVVARDAAAPKAGRKVPLFLKIAPDLQDADLEDIAAEVLEKARRRRDCFQHDDLPPCPQIARPCCGNRRAVRQAAVRALDHRARQDAQAARA